MNPPTAAQTPNALLISPEGRFLDANEEACQALGYSREELLTLAVWDIDPDFPRDRWPEHWRELRQAKTLRFQTTHRAREGSQFPVEILAHYLELDGREYNSVLAYPLTLQRQTETALRESEERLALALAVSGQGLYDLDIATGKAVFSDEYARMLGYEPSELQLTPTVWTSWLHPDDRERVLQLYEECIAGKQADYQAEFRLRTRSGGWIWVRSVGRIVQRDAAGRPLRLVGTHLDITEQKRTEAALRESEQLFRAVFEQAPHFIWVLDPEGNLLQANLTATDFARIRREDVRGQPFWETPWWRHSREEQERLRDAIRRATQGEFIHFETTHPSPDGELHIVDFTLKPVRDEAGKVIALVPEGRDITGRKRAEQALRESEEQFRALTENSYDVIMRLDRELRHVYVNPMAERQSGIPRAAFLGKTHRELGFPPELVVLWEDTLRQVFVTGEVQRVEFQLPRGYWIDWLCIPEFDAAGCVRAVMTSARDITDRKRAEDALRLSEITYREIFNGVNDTIWIHDMETFKFLDVNNNVVEMFGYSVGEALDLSVEEISSGIPPFVQATAMELLKKAAAGKPQIFEWHCKHKNGHLFWTEVNLKQATIAGKECLLAIERDITERKRMEAELERHREHLEERVAERTAELRQAMTQLIQAEKLAALGSLVAGVAHELNTPLGNTRVVASSLGEELRTFAAAVESGALRRSQVEAFLSRGCEAVDLLERNSARAADLIGHFKQVAVDQTSRRRRRFDLRQTVEELLVTLRPQFKRTAHRLEMDIPPGLELDSYPGPLEQMITNLVSNSLIHGFAGRDDGVIGIRATTPTADSVQLDYTDNGVGIAEQVRSRIFDPFFTTNLGSGGSGLGLYIVYNIVTGVLGGTIQVHSTPQAGTTFTLTLPRSAPHRPALELPT